MGQVVLISKERYVELLGDLVSDLQDMRRGADARTEKLVD